MRSKAAVGQITPFGPILAVLPPEGKNRSWRVRVTCSCGREFTERYSRVSRGKVKSCGHLRDENWARIRAERLESITPDERLRIFGLAEELGRNAAAEVLGRSIHNVGIVWRSECKRLAAISESSQGHIYAIAQRSVEKAMRMFKLTRWEVRRIHYTQQRERLSAARVVPRSTLHQSLAQAIEHGLVLDPATPECNDLLETMDSAIKNAVARLKMDSAIRATYREEFSSAELATSSPSRYGWIYNALQQMNEEHIHRCFDEKGIEFIRTCRYTLAARAARRTEHLRKLRATKLKSAAVIDPSDISLVQCEYGIETVTGLRQPAPSRRSRIGDGRRLEKSNQPTQIIDLTVVYASLLDAAA